MRMKKVISLKLFRHRDVRNTSIHRVALDGLVLVDVDANDVDVA